MRAELKEEITKPFSLVLLKGKYLYVGLTIGILVGVIVGAVDFIVYRLIWQNVLSTIEISEYSILIFPAVGLILSILILQIFKSPNTHTTEQVIRAFHEADGYMNPRHAPSKISASIITIGFGGSTGLEGVSVFVGGIIGSLHARILRPLGFRYQDMKVLAISGVAAGISALFRTPLTGVMFALGLPYKDNFVEEAVVPSLTASMAAYLSSIPFLGVEPLFRLDRAYSLSYSDIGYSVLAGGLFGIIAIVFVRLRWFLNYLGQKINLNIYLKALSAGLLIGISGLASYYLTGTPAVIGSGYEAVNITLAGNISVYILLVLLVLKIITTCLTLQFGGVGGIFIPLIAMGALSGGVMGSLVGSKVPLWAALGMAALLGAAYKSPLAGVSFVAETTANPGFLIPTLLAASIANLISGGHSVSEGQISRRRAFLAEVSDVPVEELMSMDVITAEPDMTVRDFVNKRLMAYKHKAFPVVEGERLVGMISRGDVSNIAAEEWDDVHVKEVMKQEIFVVYPDTKAREALDLFEVHDIDRAPVVDKRNPDQIIGIVSVNDILKPAEVAKFLRRESY